MTINDIQKLIAKDETRTLEVKKSTSELHKGMETACAFLNSDGGWLLFGITPKLKIDGQMVTDHTRQEIANELRKIEPAIDVEVEYIELPEKPDFYVIAIYLDATNFKNGPYSYDGRAYYKVESTTALMPRQMYEERLKLSNPKRFSWENRPNTEILVNDIDAERVYQALHDGITLHRIHASAMTLADPIAIMNKLGVARKDGTLTNAANVLFGKEPTSQHIQCKVRLARFKGTTKREFVDQTVCEGNLFEQYNAVVDFCLKHLNLSGRMDRRVREEHLTVPFEAIKEATINMLAHRTWDAENATPSVAIYDDRMVFQNPGHFPVGYTWQDFLDNQIGSLPENPTIANVFYRCGMMESWGRGIELIISTCESEDLPKPTIEVSTSFVNLTIPYAEHLNEQLDGRNEQLNEQNEQTNSQNEQTNSQNEQINSQNEQINEQINGKIEQVNEQANDEYEHISKHVNGKNGREKLTYRQRYILELLKQDGSILLNELSDKVETSYATLRRDMDFLKNNGFIERIGSRKNGSWKVVSKDN